MDYASVLMALEWAKLIIGFIFILIGAWSVIRPFYHWTLIRSPSVTASYGCAAEIIIGLLITMAGFFIASW